MCVCTVSHQPPHVEPSCPKELPKARRLGGARDALRMAVAKVGWWDGGMVGKRPWDAMRFTNWLYYMYVYIIETI